MKKELDSRIALGVLAGAVLMVGVLAFRFLFAPSSAELIPHPKAEWEQRMQNHRQAVQDVRTDQQRRLQALRRGGP
jgi:hypothetical protein